MNLRGLCFIIRRYTLQVKFKFRLKFFLPRLGSCCSNDDNIILSQLNAPPSFISHFARWMHHMLETSACTHQVCTLCSLQACFLKYYS